ncbi:protein RoBo-1-like [Lissotriton helveticus]
MQVFLTAVIFLASVITEGSSRICEQCFSMNSISCSGKFDVCPNGVTHCVTGLENKTVVPPINVTPNGYKCPACYTDKSTAECTSTGYINCVGKEDQCATITAAVVNPDGTVIMYSLKGCATKDTCDTGIFSKMLPEGYRVKLNCFSPNKV